MSSSDEPSTTTITTSQSNNLCLVCGDRALIVNYGALSCPPCRTFFRRNACHKKDVYACRYDGHCEVNVLTRKICAACRLTKCFAVGMNTDLIRKEDAVRQKRKRAASTTEEITVVAIPKESALDRPSSITSFSLRDSDWTLISNVVHAFDTFNPIPELRHRIEVLNTTKPNIEYDISQSISFISRFYNGLQLFISSTPDFKILTTSEQRSLFQRNMIGVLCVGGMYFMRETGVFDRPESESVILPLYGSEFIKQAKFICQQLNCDPVLMKLLLLALAFSSNCYMIDNSGNNDDDSLLLGTFRLLGSQTVYVELLWKYLVHRYGYNDSVQRFSRLMKQFLDMLSLSVYAYKNNVAHQNFINDIIRQTETSSIVDDKAIIPLWGKQS